MKNQGKDQPSESQPKGRESRPLLSLTKDSPDEDFMLLEDLMLRPRTPWRRLAQILEAEAEEPSSETPVEENRSEQAPFNDPDAYVRMEKKCRERFREIEFLGVPLRELTRSELEVALGSLEADKRSLARKLHLEKRFVAETQEKLAALIYNLADTNSMLGACIREYARDDRAKRNLTGS